MSCANYGMGFNLSMNTESFVESFYKNRIEYTVTSYESLESSQFGDSQQEKNFNALQDMLGKQRKQHQRRGRK